MINAKSIRISIEYINFANVMQWRGKIAIKCAENLYRLLEINLIDKILLTICGMESFINLSLLFVMLVFSSCFILIFFLSSLCHSNCSNTALKLSIASASIFCAYLGPVDTVHCEISLTLMIIWWVTLTLLCICIFLAIAQWLLARFQWILMQASLGHGHSLNTLKSLAFCT